MAPVKGVYGFRVKPGRFDEWRSMSREGEKLIARLGGRNLRSMMPAAAGPETPMCYATIDFPSAEAWGTFQDAAGREIEVQVFNERMFGHLDSPSEMLYTGLATEIQLDPDTTGSGTGPILEVYVSQPRPGRLDDAIAFGAEIAPLFVKSGATCAHLYTSGPAGTQSGTLAFVAEYRDFASYGRLLDRASALDDAEWQDVAHRALAKDAPFDIVQRALYNEVLLH
jgi:hypothetical protein